MRTLALMAGLLVLAAVPALALSNSEIPAEIQAEIPAESDPDSAGDPVGTETPDTVPDLTGTWVLNEKLSDPFEAPPGQGGTGGGQRGGGMGGGGGRGGGGGGGKGRGSQPPQEDMEQHQAERQKQMEEMKQKVARMTIFQDGLEFNVTDGQDISTLLFTDGREMTIWTDHGQATGFAAWDGPSLVTRWRLKKDQPERVRRFLLDPETDRLTVTETFSKPGSDKTTSRSMIYDRKG